jgi:hypothetical protein
MPQRRSSRCLQTQGSLLQQLAVAPTHAPAQQGRHKQPRPQALPVQPQRRSLLRSG